MGHEFKLNYKWGKCKLGSLNMVTVFQRAVLEEAHLCNEWKLKVQDESAERLHMRASSKKIGATLGTIANQALLKLITYFSTLFPIVGIPASSNTTVSVDPLSNFIYPVIHGMQHMSPVSSHQSMAATSYHQTGT